MAFLQCSEGIVTDLSNIELETRVKNCTYPLEFTYGKWYFEYQHKTGDFNYVIGFSCNEGSITADQNGEENTLNAYVTGDGKFTFNGEEISSQGKRFDTEIGFTKNGRVGIAIDFDNQYTMFLYNNKIKTFKFHSENKNKWKFYVRELKPENKIYIDTLSVYLRDFEYDIPFGANPFGLFYIRSCHSRLIFAQSLLQISLINSFV